MCIYESQHITVSFYWLLLAFNCSNGLRIMYDYRYGLLNNSVGKHLSSEELISL